MLCPSQNINTDYVFNNRSLSTTLYLFCLLQALLYIKLKYLFVARCSKQ
jgi:hypothetical protein